MPLALSGPWSLSFIAIIYYMWTDGRSEEFQRGYHLDDHQETHSHLHSAQTDGERKLVIYVKTSTCSKISSFFLPSFSSLSNEFESFKPSSSVQPWDMGLRGGMGGNGMLSLAHPPPPHTHICPPKSCYSLSERPRSYSPNKICLCKIGDAFPSQVLSLLWYCHSRKVQLIEFCGFW